MPRLNHKKARTGCQRCKARKVKCDEGQPKCSACTRHNVACVYGLTTPRDTPQQSLQAPLSDIPYNVYGPDKDTNDRNLDALLELRLMHEWTAYACQTFSTAWEFWRFQAPLIALEFRHVLDAMLAMAALYASRQPPMQWIPLHGKMVPIRDPIYNPSHPERDLTDRWRLGNININKTLASNISNSGNNAYLAAKRGHEMLTVSRMYFDRAIDGHRKALANLTVENIEAVYLTSILVSFHSLFVLSESEEDSTLPSLDSVQWLRLTKGTRFICTRWGELVGPSWITSSGVFYGKPDMHDVDDLFKRENCRPFEKLLTWAEDFEAMTPEDKKTYQEVLSYICLIYTGVTEGTDTPMATCRRLVGMPSRNDPRFTELVEAKQPRALTMLAHIFACMKLIDNEVPWFRGIAERQVPKIYEQLPVGWRAMMMEAVDGAGDANCDIKRVLILGDNYAGSSIIKALISANFDVHVAHPHVPAEANDRASYHTCKSSQPLGPLFSDLKPDLIISTAHGGGFETQKRIIDSAVEAKVTRFIPAEFGQDTLNQRIQDRLPPSRERARTIEYLRELSKDGRISWVAIATGAVLDRGILSGNLGFDIKWQSATMHGEESARFAASSSPWVGSVVSAVVADWAAVKNQYLYATGITTSAGEIVRSLEKARGKQFEVGRGNVEECVREAQSRIEKGFPDAGMFLMERSVLYDESLEAVRPFEAHDAKSKLGLEAERLEDIIKSVMHDYEHHGGNAGCGCD